MNWRQEKILKPNRIFIYRCPKKEVMINRFSITRKSWMNWFSFSFCSFDSSCWSNREVSCWFGSIKTSDFWEWKLPLAFFNVTEMTSLFLLLCFLDENCLCNKRVEALCSKWWTDLLLLRSPELEPWLRIAGSYKTILLVGVWSGHELGLKRLWVWCGVYQ